MSAYLYALTYSDDLFALPQRLINTLSRHQNIETFIPIAIRAIVVGVVFSLFKKILKFSTSRINRIFFPTAYIPSGDPSYLWISAWIAQDPYAQSQIHDFQLHTTESRSLKKRNKGALVAGENATIGKGLGTHNSSWAIREVIGQILPTYQHSIRIKHNGNYLWITRRVNGFAGAKPVEHFRVRTIAFRPHVLREFLVAARDSFFAKEERELLIFHPKRINPSWQNPVSRPSRPWSSVILPGNLKEKLLKDIEKFLSDKESHWYASRGIPHRRGYLFHGAPGSGKTTLVTAIASKLALDIHVINPAQRGMDDAKLAKLFRDVPAKNVILIEDIDCIFPRGRTYHIQSDDANGETEDGGEDEVNNNEVQPSGGGKHDLAPSTVTMSGLLNAIDGVSSQEGCVLIATTNHPNRLDPALSRAGRFDIKLEFKYAIASQARELFLHFYPLEEFQQPQSFDNTKVSNSDDQEGDTHEKSSLVVEKKEESPFEDESERVVIKDQDELNKLADQFVNTLFPIPPPVQGQQQSIDSDQPVNQAPDLPDGEEGKDHHQSFRISMASLQSYLLQHKENPVKASHEENIKDWKRDVEFEFQREKENLKLNVSNSSSFYPEGTSKWGSQDDQDDEDADEAQTKNGRGSKTDKSISKKTKSKKKSKTSNFRNTEMSTIKSEVENDGNEKEEWIKVNGGTANANANGNGN